MKPATIDNYIKKHGSCTWIEHTSNPYELQLPPILERTNLNYDGAVDWVRTFVKKYPDYFRNNWYYANNDGVHATTYKLIRLSELL